MYGLLKVTLFSLLLFGQDILADPIQVNLFAIDYKLFREGSRESILSLSRFKNREVDQQLSLLFDLNWKSLYFDNKVIGLTDRNLRGDRQGFRIVGWKFRVGMDFQFLQVGYEHFSKHLLDGEFEGTRFPVEDSFNVRFNFINNPNR